MFLSITPWFQLITHLLTQTLVHKFSDQFSLQKCAQSAKYEEWYNITVGMYEPINKASRRACSYTNNKWILLQQSGFTFCWFFASLKSRLQTTIVMGCYLPP